MRNAYSNKRKWYTKNWACSLEKCSLYSDLIQTPVHTQPRNGHYEQPQEHHWQPLTHHPDTHPKEKKNQASNKKKIRHDEGATGIGAPENSFFISPQRGQSRRFYRLPCVPTAYVT